MSSNTELVDLTLADAAVAIRRGEVSPVELTRAYLERIDAVNPIVNAYVMVTADRAMEDAERAARELASGHDRGPLHGIPIALKDLIDTAGIETAGGAAVYRGRVPAQDATVAARLREAGSVLLGKTNTHELAFGMSTNNPHFGATHNPWDMSRIPGGSSGGSGAAIAARLAVATIGTDTAGSIRIPAAFCGCVGLKPTYGLVPKDRVLAMSPMADHVGPIVRTVEDAALMLEAIAGYEPSDPSSLAAGTDDYLSSLKDGVAGLRIGVPRDTMWTFMDDEVRARADAALDVLRGLGASVRDIELPDQYAVFGGPDSTGFFTVLVEESRQAHHVAWEQHPEQFGADITAIYNTPAATGAQYAEVLERLGEYAAAVRMALVDVDVLAAPTMLFVAPLIGSDVAIVNGAEAPLGGFSVTCTAPFNIARLPAISLPCGFDGAGLPVGLQLAGRPLDEATVLRAAFAYEQATPWHQVVAPV